MRNKNTCLFYKSANTASNAPKEGIAEAVAQAATGGTNTTGDKEPSAQNPVLNATEQGGITPKTKGNGMPDVPLNIVLGHDEGKNSKGSTDGIHPGLIGGGVALVGGGLLIAYLEAQKAKRRRQKERMRNMNTNITNV